MVCFDRMVVVPHLICHFIDQEARPPPSYVIFGVIAYKSICHDIHIPHSHETIFRSFAWVWPRSTWHHFARFFCSILFAVCLRGYFHESFLLKKNMTSISCASFPILPCCWSAWLFALVVVIVFGLVPTTHSIQYFLAYLRSVIVSISVSVCSSVVVVQSYLSYSNLISVNLPKPQPTALHKLWTHNSKM